MQVLKYFIIARLLQILGIIATSFQLVLKGFCRHVTCTFILFCRPPREGLWVNWIDVIIKQAWFPFTSIFMIVGAPLMQGQRKAECTTQIAHGTHSQDVRGVHSRLLATKHLESYPICKYFYFFLDIIDTVIQLLNSWPAGRIQPSLTFFWQWKCVSMKIMFVCAYGNTRKRKTCLRFKT